MNCEGADRSCGGYARNPPGTVLPPQVSETVRIDAWRA